MENDRLSLLQNEVIDFYKKIQEALSPNKPFNDDYLGYRIFFGKFLVNPKVLFVGFNPGSGMPNVQDYEEIVFEYYNDSYPLANSAKSVFEAIGKKDWLDDSGDIGLSTKINFHYLISRNMSTFYHLLGLLPEGLRNEFYFNSKKWTLELIELMNPKYIICEGTSVYWELCDILSASHVETNIHRTYMSLAKNDNVKIFGISRFYSNYINKNGVIELLSKEMI